MAETSPPIYSLCFWFGHKPLEDVTPDWCDDYKVHKCDRGKLHINYVGDGKVTNPTEHPDYTHSKALITYFFTTYEDAKNTEEYRIVKKINYYHQMKWFRA